MGALEIFATLGTGRNHAIHRPNHPGEDRKLRRMVEHANLNGDFIIPTGDRYYFRPDFEDEEDVESARQYLAAENARANAILQKSGEMYKTLISATVTKKEREEYGRETNVC